MNKETKYIFYDSDDLRDIEKAERKKTKLENKGFNLVETHQTALSRFRLKYQKEVL